MSTRTIRIKHNCYCLSILLHYSYEIPIEDWYEEVYLIRMQLAYLLQVQSETDQKTTVVMQISQLLPVVALAGVTQLLISP